MLHPAKPSALILRTAAARAGLSPAEIRRQTNRRELVRLRRGSYLDVGTFDALDQIDLHAENIRAALAAQCNGGVVSHISAVVLHGMPMWALDLSRVHLTKQRRNSGRRSASMHVHTTPIDDCDTRQLYGLSVTSPARTMLDLAGSVPYEQAVVVVDAALHHQLTNRHELDDILDRSRGRHGRSQAELVFAFADGRSESVGESRSRVGIQRAGLPAPGLQREIHRRSRSLIGRCDFDWDWLLGEFDGLIKYARLLRPGETAGDAVVRAKLREDELRDLGHDMIRWVWADLERPQQLYPRIRAALERSTRRHRQAPEQAALPEIAE